MNCKIINDLLPMYAEGLCSDETSSEIEQHISGCDSCKSALDRMKEKNVLPEDIHNEKNIKPFKKINRRLRRSKLFITILFVFIVAIVGSIGFLTYGEIVKYEQGVSFSTIIQSIEAKEHIQLLLDGRIEEYVDKTSSYPYVSVDDFQNNEAIRNDKIERLTEAYNSFIKGKNVRIDKVQSRYYGMLNGNSKVIITNILVYIDDERINFDLEKSGDGLFYMTNSGYSWQTVEPSSEMKMLATVVDYANNPSSFYTVTYQLSEKSLVSKTGTAELFAMKFGEEYEKSFVERYSMLREKVEVTDCIFSGTLYDTETKKYYTRILLFVKENSTGNSAVIKKKIFVSGAVDFEMSDEPVEIVDGGVSASTLYELENLL